jgi:phage shock protein C
VKDIIVTNRKWARSKDGWFAGVFEGLGKNFGFDPNMLRLVWFLSVFLFGSGIFIYLLLSFVLPREDRLTEYDENKLLGVCVRLADKTGMELGLIRLLAVGSLIVSFGTTTIVYLLMFFFVDEKQKHKNYFNY